MPREPLTVRSLAALAVAAVVNLAVVFGAPIPEGLEEAVVGLVAAAALVYAVVTGRRKVTPLVSPRDANGMPLVPLNETVTRDRA